MSPAGRWYRHRYHAPGYLRVVFAVIPRLPRILHPPIAVVTAAVFYLLLSQERQAVMRNLAVVDGATGWRARLGAFRVFYVFCDFIVSYCYVPQADDGELVAMLSSPDRGAETIDACLAGGRGLLVWTAHVANWEFASRLLELHGRRVVVARVVEAGNPAERHLRALMTNDRLRAVDLLDPSAILQLLAALRAGDIVAMQGDRVLNGPGVRLPFFGRPTPFPPGPFHVALAARVPIVPGIVIRTGWLRYRMLVAPAVTVQPSLPRDVAIEQAMREAVAFLETCLRQHSHQWLNFFDIWPERRPEPTQQPCETRQ
jgi:predicted LPLAT superfamily acyltransferase